MCVTLCISFIGIDTHQFTGKAMPPRRMYTRGQSRAVEDQTENENQPQLATAAEIAELRQVVQQQAEFMQKHAIKVSYLRHLCKGFRFRRVRTE